MLRPFAHLVACCWMLLRVVAQSLKPVKLFSQQLPTFLLFRDRRSLAQQCWIRLHSSSNIVGATHAHYAWFTKTYGLYPSHDALQVPTLLGVVASVCTPLPTCTQQLPTLLTKQCWELLRPFARSLRLWQLTFALGFTNNWQRTWLSLIFYKLKPVFKALNSTVPHKCLRSNFIHSKIFNLTKYREVLVKYSLLITHAEIPIWIWHQLREHLTDSLFK